MYALTIPGTVVIDRLRVSCPLCGASLDAERPVAEAWSQAHLAPDVDAAHISIDVRGGLRTGRYRVTGWYDPDREVLTRDA